MGKKKQKKSASIPNNPQSPSILNKKVTRREAISTAGKVGIVIAAAAVVAGAGYAAYSSVAPRAVSRLTTATSTAPSTASSTAAAAKTLTLMNSFTPGPSIGENEILVHNGYLAPYDINASTRTVIGTPTAARSLVSGEVDISYLDIGGGMAADAAGADLKGFVVWGLVQPFILVGPKTIDTWKDVVGKRVAISGVGALVQQLWIGMLKGNGISQDQVTWVNVTSGGAPGRLQAVLSGTADLATIYPEDWVKAEGKPGIENLHIFQSSIAKYFPFYPINTFFARAPYINAHPDIVQDFTTALIKMTRDFYNDETKFAAALEKTPLYKGVYNDSQKIFIWQSWKDMGYFAVNGGINKAKLTKMLNYAYDVLDPKAKGNPYIKSIDDLITTQFVAKTLDQLGVVNASWDVPDWYK